MTLDKYVGKLIKKQKSVSWWRGCPCEILVGGTAWQALFDFARLKKDERTLIHAGAGGVGSFAVQFAKWAGAHVIATASAANEALVRDLGADEFVN